MNTKLEPVENILEIERPYIDEYNRKIATRLLTQDRQSTKVHLLEAVEGETVNIGGRKWIDAHDLEAIINKMFE